jgi:hypothetical protein
MFQVSLHAEFHLPISNGSLITVIKLIAKYTFLAFATFVFVILQKTKTENSERQS